MAETLENTASVIALISIGRGNVQAIGATVEAARAELAASIGGPAQVWSVIYESDAEDNDYRIIRLPAGEWTGSDADGARAHEVGEIVGYCRSRDKLRIDGFTIDSGNMSYGGPAILANVNGEEELEWLDDDGDICRDDSHLDVNRSDIYDGDQITEIYDAMQAYIDALPETERAQLRADCQMAAAERVPA